MVPVVPAPALAEVWRGKSSARLAQALHGCLVDPLDGSSAKLAGELCAKTKTDDIVDASIVVGAAKRRHAILTYDTADLKPLADAAGGLRLIDPRDRD
jgi:hypothetical protein